MRLCKILVIVCMATSCHMSLYGWSAEGHREVAIIAQQLLQPSGQFASIQLLLGKISLADIASCPDEGPEAELNHSFQMSRACESVFSNPPSGPASWHFFELPVSISNPAHNDGVAVCPEQIRTNGVETSLLHAWGGPVVSAINGDSQSPATFSYRPFGAKNRFNAEVRKLRLQLQSFDGGRTELRSSLKEETSLNTIARLHFAPPSPRSELFTFPEPRNDRTPLLRRPKQELP